MNKNMDIQDNKAKGSFLIHFYKAVIVSIIPVVDKIDVKKERNKEVFGA